MELLNSYLEILDAQNNFFIELLDIAKKKQPILVNGEIEQLDKITKEEEKIVIQVGRLEEKRNTIHQALANHFCVSADILNSNKLLTLMDDEYKNKFTTHITELQKTVNQLENINSQNQSLLEQSLEFVNFSLNLFNGIDNSPTYCENNENSVVTKIFDHKI